MEVYYRFLTREKDKIDNYFLKLQDKKGAKEKPEPIEASKVEEVKESVVTKDERGVEWYKERYEKNREHILTGKAIEAYINKIDKRTRLSNQGLFSCHFILLGNLEVYKVKLKPKNTKGWSVLSKAQCGVVVLKDKVSGNQVSYVANKEVSEKLSKRLKNKNQKLEFGEFIVVQQIWSSGKGKAPSNRVFWIVDIISIKDKDSLGLLEQEQTN